ncbi:MAG: SIMPL domain-containing protein [Firmicutes bacterium]|nr:SIMPL domain-containing protein [Bacillota bacterium]
MLRLRPDTTRISLILHGLYKEYAEALKKASEDSEVLKEVLLSFGFKSSDLKTLNFSVDAEYEGYQEEGVWKQRFTGYRFNQTMKLEFPSDNDRLGKILYALARCPVDPEFRLSYTVKDEEAAKNELLGRAVSDAKEKAEVLSKAAGVSLGEIIDIDYSWGQVRFEAPVMNRSLMAKSMGNDCAEESYAMDIEPDDIEVSDSVTVVWEIH